jgi:hypothetical protein
MAAKATILQLAGNRFNQAFFPAEKKLFEAAAIGEDADYSMDTDRIIRGDRLSWLCQNPEAIAQVTCRGVSIVGAEIDGEVNLEWTRITFPLRTRGGCTFNKAIILRNSLLDFLELANTSIKDLTATGLVVERSVLLHHGFVANGE